MFNCIKHIFYKVGTYVYCFLKLKYFKYKYSKISYYQDNVILKLIVTFETVEISKET